MNVTVRYFQTAQKAVGCASETISLPDASSIAELVKILEQRHPNLIPLTSSLLFALNEENAVLDQAMKNGDIIALLPPFSGG